MKFSPRVLLVSLACIILLYSACKKTGSKPVVAAVPNNNMAIASQMAVNLYRSFTGKYGSYNVNSGFKTTALHGALAVNSINMLCGFVVDTAFSSNLMLGDTSRAIYSSLSETYNCNGSTVNGYSLSDTTTTHDNAPGYTASSVINQQYVVTALNSSYNLVSVTGGIVANLGSSVSGGDFSSTYSTYTLSGVEVSTAVHGLPDVVKGQATFYSMIVILGPGTGIDGIFTGTTGTIVFLGNFMAKVTLAQGDVFLVNMLTGSTTRE